MTETGHIRSLAKNLGLLHARQARRRVFWWCVVPMYAAFGVLIYVAVFGTVVLNASDSLRAHGFFALKFPKPMIRGAVVVVPPPVQFADKFEGLVFAKRLVGRSGDVITHDGSSVCIRKACYARGAKNGALFGSLLPEGAIPQGSIALMGETPSSLDSRYAEVGLFKVEDVIAVGFAIPLFPHWSALNVTGARP